jgi:hypothetical protein
VADHDESALRSYDAADVALWAWCVDHGGVRTGFGEDVAAADRVRRHLLRCAVDVDESTMPVVATLEEFVDTCSPTRPVSVRVGAVCCECGVLDDVEWTVEPAPFDEVLAAMLRD